MRLISASFVALLCASSAFCAVGSWSTNGPEAAQGSSLSVSPAAPDAILLSASGAIFKSTNAGSTWTRRGTGLNSVFQVWMHPTLANTHLALSAGRLYRSTNGGTNWSAIGAGLPSGATASLTRFSVDSANPNMILVIDLYQGVFRSTNGGLNFTATSIPGLEPQTEFSAINHDPNNGLNVLLALCSSGLTSTQRSFFRSTDGGLSFVPVPTSNIGCALDGFAFSTTSSVVISNAQRSTDSGVTWTSPITMPNEPAVYRNGANELYVFDRNGVRLSIDHGDSYSNFGSGYIDNGTDLSSIGNIAFKPGAVPAVTYMLSRAGSFFKSGAGTTAFAASNSGLIASNIRAVAVHPSSSNVVLAGWGDVGLETAPALFRSTNSGASWTRISSGLGLDEIRDIEIDPNTTASVASTVLYAAGWDRAPLNTPLASRRPSIAKSTDGGLTWSHPPISAFAGIADVNAQGRARNIAIDRSSQIGGTGPSQKVYFSTRGRITCPGTGAGIVAQTIVGPRLWKTTDAGMSWTSMDSLPAGTCTPGSFGAYPVAKDIVIDPSAPNTLYVSTFLALGSETTPTVANGVFKSTDGGATWVHSSNGLPRVDSAIPTSSVRDVLALEIDPINPQILYAASNPTSGGGPGRVYKTINGGANWTLASTGISGQDVRALLIDPSDRTKIYAASGGNSTNPGGVYFSADSGITWNSTSIALPVSSATALAIDRSGAEPILYAGTNLGLWDITQVADLDADGPSNALESSAPFNGDGNQDGTPDQNQTRVASILSLSNAQRAGSAADVTFSVTAIDGDCTQINDASTYNAGDVGPEETSLVYPLGVIRFELLNCTRATVNVRYHNQSFDSSYRFRNFGPETIGNPNSVAWRDVNATRNGNLWTFVMEDNTTGDNREEANRILFIGGPGTDQFFRNGFE